MTSRRRLFCKASWIIWIHSRIVTQIPSKAANIPKPTNSRAVNDSLAICSRMSFWPAAVPRSWDAANTLLTVLPTRYVVCWHTWAMLPASALALFSCAVIAHLYKVVSSGLAGAGGFHLCSVPIPFLPSHWCAELRTTCLLLLSSHTFQYIEIGAVHCTPRGVEGPYALACLHCWGAVPLSSPRLGRRSDPKCLLLVRQPSSQGLVGWDLPAQELCNSCAFPSSMSPLASGFMSFLIPSLRCLAGPRYFLPKNIWGNLIVLPSFLLDAPLVTRIYQ